MIRKTLTAACLCCVALLFAGCDSKKENQSDSAKENSAESKLHEHGDADILVWAKKDIEQDGYLISLGHHGNHFHIGDSIEPAIMITKDGQDVEDAIVHNWMVAIDKETVLVESAKTVFEPETDAEPAHYAQAEMVIPNGAKEFIVRFKVELPGVDEVQEHDITVSVAH